MTTSTFSKVEPFTASIKERKLISKTGSTKEVFHVSLDIKDLNVAFRVGDSLAIQPENDPILVNELLESLGTQGEDPILAPRLGEMMPLRTYLIKHAHISKLTSKLLKFLAPFIENPTVDELLDSEDKEALSRFLIENEPLDLLKAPIPIQDFCDSLSPLLPRFYSIASSPHSHPDELHLTVAVPYHLRNGMKRYGLASHYLCHLADPHTTALSCYIQGTREFTLPADPATPIIMVGPGTGVAPFRAFLLERVHTNAPGKNWLFFGERHQKCDYYYESLFEDLAQMGRLKLSTAFSRDQEKRVYVQDRMLESAQEIWEWLQEGAVLYIAGSKAMGKDVDAALHTIAETHGALSPQEASLYIKSLRKQKRYLVDTY